MRSFIRRPFKNSSASEQTSGTSFFRSAPADKHKRFESFRRSLAITPIAQNCELQKACGACPSVNLDYESSLKNKFQKALTILEEKKLLTGTRVLDPVPSETVFKYRANFKLSVRKGEDGSFQIGLYQPGTHKTVDIAKCPLHVDVLRRLLGKLKYALAEGVEKQSFTPWDEQSCTGDLRYVVARASVKTEELQLVFVVSDDSKKAYFRDLIRELRLAELNVVSAFLNINTSHGNNILGAEYQKLAGQEHLRVSFAGSLLGAGAGTFLQANPWQAETIYNRIGQFCGFAESQERVWDFYCGIGPIALTLAKRGFRVWGVEENPRSIEDARMNAFRNDYTEEHLEFESALIEDALEAIPEAMQNPTLIVVNPSRRGLGEKVSLRLGEQFQEQKKLQHILYLSCEIKTLARDLEILLAKGARLRQLECFDMFPHTEKLEWLAVISAPLS